MEIWKAIYVGVFFWLLREADAVNAVVGRVQLLMSVRPSEGLYSLVMMGASRHSRNDNVVSVSGALPDGRRVVMCANTTPPTVLNLLII